MSASYSVPQNDFTQIFNSGLVFVRGEESPEESKYPWDYYKLVATIPADEAWLPLDKSVCLLVKKN